VQGGLRQQRKDFLDLFNFIGMGFHDRIISYPDMSQIERQELHEQN
jgi:hypothetical protein